MTVHLLQKNSKILWYINIVNSVASDYFESGGGQTYICVTSVRAQRALIAAGGPGGRCQPPAFFSDLVVSESFSDKF